MFFFLLTFLIAAISADFCSFRNGTGLLLNVPGESKHIFVCSVMIHHGSVSYGNSTNTSLLLHGDFSRLLQTPIIHLETFFGSELIGCDFPDSSDGDGGLSCECSHVRVTNTSYTCFLPELFASQPLVFFLVDDSYDTLVSFTTDLDYTYSVPTAMSVNPNSGQAPIVVRLSGANLPLKNTKLMKVFIEGTSQNIACDISDLILDPGVEEDLYLTLDTDVVGAVNLQLFVGVEINGTLTGVFSNAIPFTFKNAPQPYLLIIGVPVAAVLVLLCGVLAFKKISEDRKKKEGYEPLLRTEWERQWMIDSNEILIGDVIGKGSFATVYKGTWKSQVVAVKLIQAAKREEEIMFDAECVLLSGLHHPNILQLFGTAVSGRDMNKTFLLVTEYMALGSMSEFLATPAGVETSLKGVLTMLLGAARGVLFLHTHSPPIIHRDLKTSNLLLDAAGNVKIADFGLSRADGNGTMTACGTPKYAAPEVLNHNKYDTSADTWSYGVTIWECVARSPAYNEIAPMQVAVRVANTGSFLSYVKIPIDIADLIQICQNFNPKHRRDFVYIISTLERIIRGLGTPPPPSTLLSLNS